MASSFEEVFSLKHNSMKTTRSNDSKQSKQGISKKPKPDVRDDLDSRKKKEIRYKGDKSKKGDR
jgi:hypothetical protein